MNYFLFICYFLRFIFLTKRKNEELFIISKKDRNILQLNENNKNLTLSNETNFLDNLDEFENEYNTVLNDKFSFTEEINVDIFSQITKDLYTGCMNETNNIEIIKRLDYFRSMCLYDLTMSSDFSFDFYYDFLLNIFMNSKNFNQKKKFNILKSHSEPIIVNYDNKISSNIYIDKSTKHNDLNVPKLKICYLNLLNKIKLQILHKNWIYNKLILAKFDDDNNFSNFFRGFEFINKLLHAFLIVNKFDTNLKKDFYNKNIDNGNFYKEIFLNLNLKINFDENQAFCKTIYKKKFINFKEKDNNINDVLLNNEIIVKLDSVTRKYTDYPIIIKKKDIFKIPKLSLFNLDKNQILKYFFNINPLSVIHFIKQSTNFLKYCLQHNLDILSKQSFKYIIEQISQINNICDKLLFYIVFFINVFNNYLIKTSISRLTILLHLYKSQIKNYVNKDLQNFQVKIWYLLLYCIKPTIDLEFNGIPKILSIKFKTLIYYNFNENKINDVLDYYVYTIFLFQNNKTDLVEKFSLLKEQKILPVDELSLRKSEIFLHFILKILFDNNLLD